MEFVEFQNKKEQERFVRKAVEKAGSERKLASEVGIPKSSVFVYLKAEARMPYERLKRILDFLQMEESSIVFKIVSSDEWVSRGGKKALMKKIKNGSLEQNLERMWEVSSLKLKKWHREMKRKDRETYFRIQYERFKKIGSYKFTTKKGEKVRNSLERDVANILFDLGVDYEYEPFVDLGCKVYFPDFKTGNRIIEATMWRGSEKAVELKKKIADLEGAGFHVSVVVPAALEGYYKIIERNLVRASDIRSALK